MNELITSISHLAADIDHLLAVKADWNFQRCYDWCLCRRLAELSVALRKCGIADNDNVLKRFLPLERKDGGLI